MFYFISLGAALFSIGIYGLLARKELVGKLLSIMLLFNAVLIMYATFNRYVENTGLIGIVLMSFIMLSLVSLLLIGAYLIFRQYSKTSASENTTLNLFE